MAERRIRLLVHNVRSLWNVGSFFRTSDAFNIERIILSGYTPCPPRKEISKIAIGAEVTIPWVHVEDPSAILLQSQKEGFSVVTLERTQKALSLSEYRPKGDVLLVVGNELAGVPQSIIDSSELVVQIPMLGSKESLNVSVAAGIALHHIRASTHKDSSSSIWL